MLTNDGSGGTGGALSPPYDLGIQLVYLEYTLEADRCWALRANASGEKLSFAGVMTITGGQASGERGRIGELGVLV